MSSSQPFIVFAYLEFTEAGPLKFGPWHGQQHWWNFFFTQNADGTWSNTKANYAGKEVDGGLGVINVGPENTPVYGIVADPQDAKWNLGRMSASPYFGNAIPYLPGGVPAASPVRIGDATYLQVGSSSSSSMSSRTQLQHAYSKEGLSLVSLQAHRSGAMVSFSDAGANGFASQEGCNKCFSKCLKEGLDFDKCIGLCAGDCECSCKFHPTRS